MPAPLYRPSHCRHGVTDRRRRAFMRRGTMLVLGLSAGLHRHAADRGGPAAAPEDAPGHLTAPFGAILGAGRPRRPARAHHRRATASRPRPAAAAAARLPRSLPAPRRHRRQRRNRHATCRSRRRRSRPPARRQPTERRHPGRQRSAAADPAPPQRNAALAAPDDEPQAAQREPAPRRPRAVPSRHGRPAGLADRL